MIAYLEGTLRSIGDQFVIVVVQGIGYKVFVQPSTLAMAQVGADIALHTHQHVREDSLDLFGFERPEDLRMFEKLIGVSGIGPKTALNILGMTSAEQLRSAVLTGNAAVLTKVSGIGKKMAERLLIELKDTFTAEAKRQGETMPTMNEGDLEVIEALEQLGYGISDARKALEEVSSEVVGSEARLKAALRKLAK